MLSHHNLSWTCDLAVQLVTLGPQDLCLSYLPLSHIAEQMFSIHAPLRVGSQVYFFSDAPEKLRDYLGEVQPTVFFGVPRVWEKMHAALTARIGQATGARAKLAAWALSVGRRCGALRCRGEQPSGWLAMQEKLAERLVLAKVRAAIGFSRTHTAVSGAAPVSAEVLEFFSSLGLYISEVYGQSEDCGPTTFNRKGAIRYGTVGQRIPGVEVELAPDGEVRVRGPNVFLGYFKDPAATALALQDGWLCSGDLGAFDEEGYLRIIGRKKEILITSGGKNIAPVNIEAALKDLPLVGQAVVIGDRRHYLTAVLSLDPEALRDFAEKRGLSGLEPAALREHPLVRAELDRGLEEVNARFARVEHVRKYAVLPRELSVEGGELTPTLKVKRRKVDENWRDLIEAMYAGPAP
jgi:long-chain acyl-CoA synthetase